MPRRLRSSIRPKEEATTQQLSLPLTENHTRASSGANEPQKRKRSHDTPTRLSEQPARKRRAGKKENAKAKKKITDFPHEVILNIITKLDFSRDDFMKMRLAIRTFNELLMAHRTTIINDIAAQQFPFVSLLVLRIAPTVQWLVNVKDLEDKTEQFLSACTRRLKRYSAQFKALADPHYKMIAQVGLHVIAAQRVLIEDELEDLEWFYLPERFPDTLVLCISFAGAIVAQAAECFFQDAPYQDRNERFRRTSDSLLCTDGWDGMWAFLVGPSLKLKGDTAKLTRESGKVWGREFRTFLGLVDMDDEHYDEHDEEKAMDAGSVGLRLKIKVEELVGEHATREMLDLAVIEALEESKVSEKAILELLRRSHYWLSIE